MPPTSLLIALPSRLAVGEPFAIKVKVLGPVVQVPVAGNYADVKPRLQGPFNRNHCRGIHYLDNALPAWKGTLRVDGGGALEGPEELVFDGARQGAFPGDTRPIGTFEGFRWREPGFHFVELVDTETGVRAWSNPVFVTEEPPALRLYWGDPHWQTYFSDGIRCPEELYAFARDEAFLDFGAISDHMEAITPRQWGYFCAVTNDYDEPGRFVTLVGQEWTSMACGHRNVYYRGDGGPLVDSTAPDCDTLDKLWRKIAGHDAVVIPHHSAAAAMGCDWDLGWNPDYETTVEIHSVWGSSECHADDGNPHPIRVSGGENRHGHVAEALRRGFRFGFVGGGDIHDGRPGDELHSLQESPDEYRLLTPQGFTGAWLPALTRDALFDALRARRTYATMRCRLYLELQPAGRPRAPALAIRAASEDGLSHLDIVRNGTTAATLRPGDDPRVLEQRVPLDPLGPGEFVYVRAVSVQNRLAWGSPVFGSEQSQGRLDSRDEPG